MINQSTVDQLKAMRLSAMAHELETQMQDSSYNDLGFEDRLGLLVNAEWTCRQSNKLRRYINNAHFSDPSATIENIEYYPDRKLDKAQILRFSTGQFIEDGHHIILKGASGNGKTYLACAIGCRPAVALNPCGIFVCLNCWRIFPWRMLLEISRK